MQDAAPQEISSSAKPSFTLRFAQGAFWSLVGSFGTRLLGFAGNVIVARLLGQVGFGELAMILSTLGLLGTFSGLGIGGTATKYVAELRLRDPERTGRIIGLSYLVSWIAGGFLALFCFLAAPWLAAQTLNAPHLTPEVRLASLLLFISTGFGPQGAILSGFQAFRTIAKVNWWTALSGLLLTVILVWLAGLWGVILSFFLNDFLGAGLFALFLRREYKVSQVRINFRGAWAERSVLWGFSLPVFLTSLIGTPAIWISRLVLVHQPDGYAQLGLFNAAMQFNWLITGINFILSTVWMSFLSEIHGQGDIDRFTRVFNLNLRLNWSVAIIFGFAVLFVSPWLIRIFGAKFTLAAPLLPLVICYTAFSLANSVFYQVYYSSGRMWVTFSISLIGYSIFVLIVCFLVPKYLGKGLVFSHVISTSFWMMVNLVVLGKIFGRALLSNIGGCLFAAILLLGGGLIITFQELFAAPLLIVGLLGVFALFLIINSNYSIFKSLVFQFSEIVIAKGKFLYATRK